MLFLMQAQLRFADTRHGGGLRSLEVVAVARHVAWRNAPLAEVMQAQLRFADTRHGGGLRSLEVVVFGLYVCPRCICDSICDMRFILAS
jgi:hypothetical protein